jgi:hypothetical protein
VPISIRQLNRGKRYSDMQRAEVIAYVTDVEARYRIDGREKAAVKFGISKRTINKWIYGKRTRKEAANARRLGKAAALAVLITRKKKEVELLKARFEAMWEAL